MSFATYKDDHFIVIHFLDNATNDHYNLQDIQNAFLMFQHAYFYAFKMC